MEIKKEELLEKIIDIALEPIKPIIDKLNYQRDHPEERRRIESINSKENPHDC